MSLLSRLGLRPRLSVVIVFHNMRREAERTLYGFTTDFQQGVREAEYEVLVIDSNSAAPLDGAWVESLQGNFRYQYVPSDVPTPNKAMNAGIAQARGEWVTCLIDGARIPSPGILRQSLDAQAWLGPAYVMTLGMHLGPDRQQFSVSDGYCQAEEDRLLETVDWRTDGYALFTVSVPAGSSSGGYFQGIAESNCFTVPTAVMREIGGFDERFVESGGGLINLHVHNQLVMHPRLRPVMLLGEATFHQFHGGVSTNVPQAESPFGRYCQEYERILGRPFDKAWREPAYLGHMPEAAKRFLYIED